MHTHMHTYTHIYIYIYKTHTYIYIITHTHAHTHTHMTHLSSLSHSLYLSLADPFLAQMILANFFSDIDLQRAILISLESTFFGPHVLGGNGDSWLNLLGNALGNNGIGERVCMCAGVWVWVCKWVYGCV